MLIWQSRCVIIMHNLRNALGRQAETEQVSVSRMGPSKLYNKSRSVAMWALDPELDEQDGHQKSKADSKLKQSFLTNIETSYKQNSVFSQMCFFDIVEKVQAESEGLQQLDCLLAIEGSARNLSESGQERFRVYMESFSEYLIRRIKKLRRKEKKTQLQEYQKIVKGNFHKKGGVQYIDEQKMDRQSHLEAKQKMGRKFQGSQDRVENGSQNEGSSRQNGSSSSTEGKLGKLLSGSKLKDEKKSSTKQEQNQRKQCVQESISFSAVVSQSMAVRQRRPKQQKRSKKQKQVPLAEKKQQGESEGKDQAFIFYRPKAGKKK